MLEKLNARGAVALYTEGTLVTVNGKVVGPLQMNHPPFSLTLLRFWGALRRLTGLPLGFWLRLSCALADLFVLWLLYRLGLGEGDGLWALLVLALSPAAILISGFHGNTDPIMIAFVVLAVFLIERGKPTSLAGGAFGLACSVKVWPILLLPILVLGVGSIRRRIEFCAAAGFVAIFAGMPWLLWSPSLILRRVFNYTPFSGWWGLSYLYPSAAPHLSVPMFLCVLVVSIYIHTRLSSIFSQCAIATALFFFLTPGFGPQYLAWILPWTIAAGWQASAGLHLSAGIFLFGVYNSWSGGRIPWYFADANLYLPASWVLPVGLISWGWMIILIFRVYRRFANLSSPKKVPLTHDTRTQSRPTGLRRRKRHARR
jgi:hypothetical protein